MADDTNQHPAPNPSGSGSDPESGSGSRSEKWAEKQVALRVLVYVFVTHAFAGFIWLLFYIGDHANK
ncbi:hypothetical protein B7P34_21800 [Streptosporangium nondiastaticum]|uniref:Small hydrophobic protein n=1 Tax=Streptosporangium nondiastaticum TaxID=35764 RepID=A0A9X7JNE1_9ACTN|nr:DUF6126 family protein [Streptosporangium nondiastaticum]PSJ26626.1 hypothetical protein B7P34_21800 [Streptosporangium nondiastaticum]